MCFYSSSYSLMFDLHSAELKMCRVWHEKVFFHILLLKVLIFSVGIENETGLCAWHVTSHLFGSQSWSSVRHTQVQCGNFKASSACTLLKDFKLEPSCVQLFNSERNKYSHNQLFCSFWCRLGVDTILRHALNNCYTCFNKCVEGSF